MPAQLFTYEEIMTFLSFVRETNTLKQIDGRVQRNIDVFANLSSKMSERYPNNKKTAQQLRTKWKNLKGTVLKLEVVFTSLSKSLHGEG